MKQFIKKIYVKCMLTAANLITKPLNTMLLHVIKLQGLDPNWTPQNEFKKLKEELEKCSHKVAGLGGLYGDFENHPTILLMRERIARRTNELKNTSKVGLIKHTTSLSTQKTIEPEETLERLINQEKILSKLEEPNHRTTKKSSKKKPTKKAVRKTTKKK